MQHFGLCTQETTSNGRKHMTEDPAYEVTREMVDAALDTMVYRPLATSGLSFRPSPASVKKTLMRANAVSPLYHRVKEQEDRIRGLEAALASSRDDTIGEVCAFLRDHGSAEGHVIAAIRAMKGRREP
jgi:hypothetical protein